MAWVRIDVVKGRSEAELSGLLDAVHDAMVDAFDVPKRDRYQVLTEHESARLVLQDSGLGFPRTDRRVLIQVLARPRSVDQKRKLYGVMTNYLFERFDINPLDVMITCVDNQEADWSFDDERR